MNIGAARIIIEHEGKLWEWVKGAGCSPGVQCRDTSFCHDLASGLGTGAICNLLPLMGDEGHTKDIKGHFKRIT